MLIYNVSIKWFVLNYVPECCVCVRVYIYIYMCASIYIYIYIYIGKVHPKTFHGGPEYMYVCMYVYIYIYIYIFVCVCVYTIFKHIRNFAELRV